MKAFIHMDISMRHISTGDIKMASKFDCEQNKKQEAEEWQSSAIVTINPYSFCTSPRFQSQLATHTNFIQPTLFYVLLQKRQLVLNA